MSDRGSDIGYSYSASQVDAKFMWLERFIENKVDELRKNTEGKFDELRTSTSGKLSEISHHLDARDSEVMAIMKSEDERVASQLTSFIREEVQRVVKSLQKLSPSEAEDLFG